MGEPGKNLEHTYEEPWETFPSVFLSVSSFSEIRKEVESMMKKNENRVMLEINNGYILANYSIFLGTELTEIVVVHIGK